MSIENCPIQFPSADDANNLSRYRLYDDRSTLKGCAWAAAHALESIGMVAMSALSALSFCFALGVIDPTPQPLRDRITLAVCGAFCLGLAYLTTGPLAESMNNVSYHLGKKPQMRWVEIPKPPIPLNP